MDQFTQAYKKLRKVVYNQTFAEDWETLIWESGKAQKLLKDDHISLLGVELLDEIRWKLKKVDAGKRPQAMLDACKSDDKTGSLADRAGALKMLAHLYQEMSRGGQDVWVYSPPKAYKKWVFDEITGSDETKIKAKLGDNVETYTSGDRQVMVNALGVARKWSLDAVVKLASPTDATKAIVRRWFADEKSSDKDVDNMATKLKDGFKKIGAKCNSSRVIFSDDPIDRRKVYDASTGHVGWDDWAFVTDEKMDVIYLQGAFLQAGSTGQIWQCALTIIHELSHRELKTDDILYSEDGLKPNSKTFPARRAMKNADNWGFFATDLAGCLGASDRNQAWKAAA